MMNEGLKRGSFLKSIAILIVLFVIAGGAAAIKYFNEEKEAASFVAKFEKIREENTAQEVMDSLGLPSQTEKSEGKTKKVLTDLPVEIWYYDIGNSRYFIQFRPPGLEHWDDLMKWQVELKGTVNE